MTDFMRTSFAKSRSHTWRNRGFDDGRDGKEKRVLPVQYEEHQAAYNTGFRFGKQERVRHDG